MHFCCVSEALTEQETPTLKQQELAAGPCLAWLILSDANRNDAQLMLNHGLRVRRVMHGNCRPSATK